MFTLSELCQSTNGRLILASAASFEASQTISVLKQLNINFTYLEVGIGAIRSAIIAKDFSSLVAGRAVLFVGSCGTSENFSQPFLTTASHVTWNPSDVRQSRSYLIPNAEPPIKLEPLKHSSLRIVQISCASSISTQIDPTAHIYENLELYSVATVWRPLCSNFTSVIGVTNQLGPSAHQQWKDNFSKIASMTADLVGASL